MSIPDFDYELENILGQFEYSVPLAAMRPEETSAVKIAFGYGQDKERDRILSVLESMASHGYVNIPLFKLRKIINND